MQKKEPLVSIIIPCREIDKYTRECLQHCIKLDYKNFEILLLPDEKQSKKDLQGIKLQKLRIIPTGKVKPAIKRNVGILKARGTIYAFIDSDAYPARDWLKNAVRCLSKEETGLVGGPNLTPQADNFKQKISGMLLANLLCAGPRASIRYRIAKKQFTPELPSCNFLVKKEIVKKLKLKFQPELLTEEDSKFCFDIVKSGKKVLYAPDVAVYHHRREIFMPHLKQIWVYGRDVAFLFKKEFSPIMLYYTLLSLFVLGTISGAILSFFSSFTRTLYFIGISIYLATVLAFSIRKDIKTTLLLFSGIIGTHFTYGLGFLYGLLTKNKAELNVR